MATLTLTLTWLNLIPSGEAVASWSLVGRVYDAEVDGEIHKFAGGRFMGVHEEGVRRSYDFTFTQITRAQRDTLESWLGQTVQLRTHNGEYLVGTFFAIGANEYKNNTYAAAIVIRGVTAQEVVIG